MCRSEETVLIENENNIKSEKYTGPSIWEDDRNRRERVETSDDE